MLSTVTGFRTADAGDSVEPGTKVEVRSRFERSWARGFEIAEVVEAGYRIRRLSDGSILPLDFSADDVRAEKKKSDFWWY